MALHIAAKGVWSLHFLLHDFIHWKTATSYHKCKNKGANQLAYIFAIYMSIFCGCTAQSVSDLTGVPHNFIHEKKKTRTNITA